MSYSIPHLHVVGTNYQIGFEIVCFIDFTFKFIFIIYFPNSYYFIFCFFKGKEFEKRIKKYLDTYGDLKTKIIPFTKTEFGMKVHQIISI